MRLSKLALTKAEADMRASYAPIIIDRESKLRKIRALSLDLSLKVTEGLPVTVKDLEEIELCTFWD